MMGLEFTDQPPFHTIYLHGLVRDEQGRKMSKTLGNVIDPLDVMDEFGTDALRFTLLTGSTPGNDMNLSLQRVEANRNFANKLWNAGRLVLMALEKAAFELKDSPEPTIVDRWIQARLNGLLRDVDRLFDNYQYAEAGRQIYEFFWGEYADWYLEVAKLQLDEGGDRAWLTAWTMAYVLDTCLRLLHPYTPYVTEELWGILKDACQDQPAGYEPEGGWDEALIVSAWPEPPAKTSEEDRVVERFSLIMDVVRAIRNLRAERGVDPARRIEAIINGGELADLLISLRRSIAVLARLDPIKLKIHSSLEKPPSESVPLVVGPIEVYLPLAGMVDMTEEKARLSKELDEIDAQIKRLETLLAGPFSERAPSGIVQKERKKLALLKESASKINGQLRSLG
jgi:valyl-tRNA synthetase